MNELKKSIRNGARTKQQRENERETNERQNTRHHQQHTHADAPDQAKSFDVRKCRVMYAGVYAI